MYSYADVFANKQRIMFFGAHPDDIDVFYGGLIARLRSDGKDVHCVVVTTGARGSKDNDISLEELAKVRQKEETEAFSHLGVTKDNITFLGFMDGEIGDDKDVIEKIVRAMRSFQPEVVCTHNPKDLFYSFQGGSMLYVNHRDHRQVGQHVIDAVYPMSRDVSFFPEQIKEGLKACEVKHIVLTGEGEVNLTVDTYDYIDKKRKALLSHKSQFSEELVSDILDMFEDGNKETGFYIELAF